MTTRYIRRCQGLCGMLAALAAAGSCGKEAPAPAAREATPLPSSAPAVLHPYGYIHRAEPKFKPAVALRDGRPVTVALEVNEPSRLLLAEAAVNGKRGTFIIDTAAGITTITPDYARQIDARVRISVPVRGNLSTNRITFSQIPRMAVGRAIFTDFEAAEIDLAHVARPMKRDIAGILGANVLLATACRIDTANRQWIIGAECPAEGGHPYRLDDRRPSVDAAVDGMPLSLLVDSGSTRSFLLEKMWKGVVEESGREQRSDINGNEKAVPVRMAATHALHIGEQPVEGVRFALNATHAVLGMDFFEHYTVTFDPARMRLWFSPPTPPIRPATSR